MTALVGQSSRVTIAGLFNQHLSTDLSGFDEEVFVASFYAADTLHGAAKPVPHRLAPGLGRGIAAVRVARSYFDDFYNRIHVRPEALRLGNLPSAQTRSVEVWNAFLTPQQLLDVEIINGGGVELSAPAALPMAFAPLQSRTWQVGVGLSGPPVIDATIIWTFAGGASAALPITGTRVTAWTFPANWTTSVIERLSWLTDVLESASGASQRRALRDYPRGTYEFGILAEGRDRALLDLSVFAWGSRVWAVPVLHDVELTRAALSPGATTVPSQGEREYRAGGLAMLLGKDGQMYEVFEIETIAGDGTLQLAIGLQSGWPRGTKLYPVRRGQLDAQPEFARLNDRLWSGSVRMQLVEPVDFPPAAPLSLYRGFPVLTLQPSQVDDLTATFARLTRPLDNQTGVPAQADTAGLAFPVQAYRWLVKGRGDYNRLRGHLYALRGRQRCWWLPTFAADLELAVATTALAPVIDVGWCGYTIYGAQRSGRRDIRVELRDGTVLQRRITGSQVLDSETERLTLDAALGRVVTPAQVRRISYMVLSTSNQDDIELEHTTDADGITQCSVTFRGRRDDLEVPA